MAETLTNQSSLDLELCNAEVTIVSNEIEVNELDLTMTKTADCAYFVVGSVITFCVEIANGSDIELEDLHWYDVLDDRFTYVDDSFTVDGQPETPTIEGQEISWDIDTLGTAAEQPTTTTICFQVKVGAATGS